MSLTRFIRENRKEIDQAIESVLGHTEFRHNDSERRLWVLNDESLANWAESHGVKIL